MVFPLKKEHSLIRVQRPKQSLVGLHFPINRDVLSDSPVPHCLSSQLIVEAECFFSHYPIYNVYYLLSITPSTLSIKCFFYIFQLIKCGAKDVVISVCPEKQTLFKLSPLFNVISLGDFLNEAYPAHLRLHGKLLRSFIYLSSPSSSEEYFPLRLACPHASATSDTRHV